MNHALTFIHNHLIMVGAWVICALAIIVTEIKNKASGPTKLSPQQLVELINAGQVKVIDIRKPEQFRAAHILHAKNIPWNQQDEAAFANLNQDKLILVCEQGQTAQQLAIKLKKMGMPEPEILAGGLAAWKQNNLPLVKGK